MVEVQLRVLFIVDNDYVYSTLSTFSSGYGNDRLDTECVTSNGDIVAALAGEQYHAALIDLQVGEQRALELLQMIRARSPQTAVLVLGGHAQNAAYANSLQAGADDFLDMQQLDPPLLRHRVQKAIDHKRLLAAERQHRALVPALRDAAEAMNSALELGSLLDRILADIDTVIPHDAANIVLIDSDIVHVVRFHGYVSPEQDLVLHQPLDERADLQAIITDGAPLVITDTQTYPGWTASMGPGWVRSHVSVPLHLHDEIVGFLSLESKTPAYFDSQQVAWLQIFAEQIGSALYNTRLYYAETKRRQEIEALRKTTSLVSSTLELDRLMHLLLSQLQAVVPYDAVTVFLVDGVHLEIVASSGGPYADRLIGERIEAERYALFRELARIKQIVSVADARSDPRFDDWDVLRTRRSWLGVPLLAHGACIGYMIVDSDQVAAYDDTALALVRSFANQAAVAIYNAQLYEEVRRYANELEDRVARRTAQLHTAKAEVERSEQRYRALFEATFEGICVHEQGMLLDANPAFERMFGYSHDEIVGMYVWNLAEGESRDRMIEHVRQQDERPYEVIGIRKDGTAFPLEILGKKYSYEGRPVRVAAMRDITERKQLEQQHIALTLERERIQILSNFITQASHEFRTSLSVINLNAEMLVRLSDSDDYKQRARRITQYVEHMTILISNMVTLSRLDNETQSLATEIVDLNQIVHTAGNVLAAAHQKTDLEIVVELCEDPLPVMGDPDYLEQAIGLLLENAVRYTPAGRISVSAERNGEHAVIQITDTGIGISEDDLPHIFERFYRADKVSTTRGFGLGLPIAQGIVQRHGGQLEVQSALGRGSIFRITVPALTE